MKYIVLIIDGASGRALPEYGGKTCLELASTPNLDAMAKESAAGMLRTIPEGMEPSSACGCMSLFGYDPRVYYRGRASIEARSMGISVEEGDVVFRCNLVAVRDGKMFDYSGGHITTEESKQLVIALNENLADDRVLFYPGIAYRHILKITGREDTLSAVCTPPHDIPGRGISEYLPHGPGSDFLNDLMKRSEAVLKEHPVNLERKSRGETEPNTIWLFWGSSRLPEMPSFKTAYGLDAAMTSGVDLLGGLAQMAGMEILDIAGVNDGLDNDYTAQIDGALEALGRNDLAIVHIEAPDEAAHGGSVDEKVEAIRRIDEEVVSRIRAWRGDELKVLVSPDHPTPIELRTHSNEPVPFMLWGEGFINNGAIRLTEPEAVKTGLYINPGYNIMRKLIGIV
ncbi:cofactor-independent phosphoglycerate mutase [Chloroflexota bacterium]